MKFDIYVLREVNITCIGEDQNYLLSSGTFLKGFKLIHLLIGVKDNSNKKRTSKNTNPSYNVARAGLEPATFGL
tara:strand:+ start:4632 stop:4853 length:222 start_codon:yes stop_codon:yes gene_type:complete